MCFFAIISCCEYTYTNVKFLCVNLRKNVSVCECTYWCENVLVCVSLSVCHSV